MAYISNGKQVGLGALTTVYTDATKFSLGEVVSDELGKQYIFLTGVASTVAGSWVTFDEAYLTTLIAANAVGPVGVAMAATVASTYGFYQIYGNCAVSASDTTAADVALYIDGTAGRVDDAVVTGDLVVGACSTAADTANVLPVFLNFPFVTNVLG